MPFEPMTQSTENKRNTESSEKRQSPFIRIQEGVTPIIRIIDANRYFYWSYWLPDVNVGGARAGRSIVVGKNNPIAKVVDAEGNPKYRLSAKYRFNVLERTPDENGTPLNEIKIMDCSRTLMEEIIDLSTGHRLRHNNQFATIHDLDFKFTTKGSGREKRIRVDLVSADRGGEDVISSDILSLPRFDIEALCQPIPNDAIERILAGEDYNEVMMSLGRSGDYPMVNP